MARIIAIANQKGGVGKTTTAINLSACLAESGQKILSIDMDPQGNMTSGLGLTKGDDENTVYELLMGDADFSECLRQGEEGHPDVISSDADLAGAEIELLELPNKESVLKEKLSPVRDNYDYVIIDCPPSLSLLTINALACADSVLIPIQCEYYALEGLTQMLRTINLVQTRINPALTIEGIVFTMYDARTNLSAEVVENVKQNLQEYMFETVIPRNVRLAEAPSHGMPINEYDSRSSGAESYRMLAAELMNKE